MKTPRPDQICWDQGEASVSLKICILVYSLVYLLVFFLLNFRPLIMMGFLTGLSQTHRGMDVFGLILKQRRVFKFHCASLIPLLMEDEAFLVKCAFLITLCVTVPTALYLITYFSAPFTPRREGAFWCLPYILVSCSGIHWTRGPCSVNESWRAVCLWKRARGIGNKHHCRENLRLPFDLMFPLPWWRGPAAMACVLGRMPHRKKFNKSPLH